MKNKPTIEEELEIESIPVELDDTTIESKGYEEDIEADYVLARKYLYHAMIRATELIDASVREMKGNPTAMGVKGASDAIKVLTDNTYRLMELHEKIRDAKNKNKHEKEEEIKDESKQKLTFNNVVSLVRNKG